MNLDPLNIFQLLQRHNLKPDKRLGQNFLVDPIAFKRILDAADLKLEDTVLEIGAGLGSLTRYLCSYTQKVIAVELDEKLLPVLKEVLLNFHNVEIIQGDILKINLEDVVDQSNYKVVANIPYYITSKLIRHLLETKTPPNKLVLTVQHEVALRICALPGKMSLLSLAVQVYGHPQIYAKIPAGAFFPVPKVNSAIVRVDLYSRPSIPPQHLNTFFLLARAGFQQKRKTLRNSLSAAIDLPRTETEQFIIKAGIDPRRRAETLSIEEWYKLVQVFKTEVSTQL